jgi:hypothetical protein
VWHTILKGKNLTSVYKKPFSNIKNVPTHDLSEKCTRKKVLDKKLFYPLKIRLKKSVFWAKLHMYIFEISMKRQIF